MENLFLNTDKYMSLDKAKAIGYTRFDITQRTTTYLLSKEASSMERGIYFDGWFKNEHCYHPSLPARVEKRGEDAIVTLLDVGVYTVLTFHA